MSRTPLFEERQVTSLKCSLAVQPDSNSRPTP